MEIPQQPSKGDQYQFLRIQGMKIMKRIIEQKVMRKQKKT